MSNKHLKETRAASWSRGNARKETRRRAQTDAEKRNTALRLKGLLTPWREAKAARRARRTA